MSIVKMQRSEVVVFANKIDESLKSNEILSFDIVYALNKTKNKVKIHVEAINDFLSDMQKQSKKLVLAYCEKDNEGKPIIKNDRYTGLETGQQPEYDRITEENNKKTKEYLREEVDVEIHSISRDVIPKKGNMMLLDVLCYFIDD